MTLNLDEPIIAGDGTIELSFKAETDANLVGATVKFSLRRRSVTGPVVLSKTGTITDDAEKEFSFFLTKSDTADLSGVYFHDAVIIDASGNEITLRNSDGTAGRIEFSKRVTVV